jgi:hypothetical protein
MIISLYRHLHKFGAEDVANIRVEIENSRFTTVSVSTIFKVPVIA